MTSIHIRSQFTFPLPPGLGNFYFCYMNLPIQLVLHDICLVHLPYFSHDNRFLYYLVHLYSSIFQALTPLCGWRLFHFVLYFPFHFSSIPIHHHIIHTLWLLPIFWLLGEICQGALGYRFLCGIMVTGKGVHLSNSRAYKSTKYES